MLVSGIIVLPGMDMAFVLASALADGARAGFAAVAGMVVGGFVHVLASALGLSLLLSTWPTLFNALLMAGGLYVAWMGWQLWRGAAALGAVQVGASRPLPATFGRAVLTCLMNPKAYLFCLAVVPQFIRPEQGRAAVRGAVGLQALEDLLRVVQHRGGRIEGDGLARLDPRVVPAAAGGVARHHHVVCEHLAEARIRHQRGPLLGGPRGRMTLDLERQVAHGAVLID